jgi:hypothetical protein
VCHPDQASHASLLVILKKASAGIFFCHPDEVSNASGWKDLGQRGASAAGSGSEFRIR